MAKALTEEPTAEEAPTNKVPAWISIPPLKVFVPVIVRAPAPFLVSELEPEMLAEMVTLDVESTSSAEVDSEPTPELTTLPP